MEIDKTKIKKIEAACFFFKKQMDLQVMTDEAVEEMNASALENLLSVITKKKRAKFKAASKELCHSLKAEGDMFFAYEASPNGKQGFVVTSKGVYVKSNGEHNFVDFDKLSQIDSLRFEDNELRADGKLLALLDGSEEEKEKLISIFEEVIDILNDTSVADND